MAQKQKPDPGCARCGWLESEHGRVGSRFACGHYEASASDFATQLQKALAAAHRRSA